MVSRRRSRRQRRTSRRRTATSWPASRSWGLTDVDFRVKPDVVAPGAERALNDSRAGPETRRHDPVLVVLPGHLDGELRTSRASPPSCAGQHPAWSAPRGAPGDRQRGRSGRRPPTRTGATSSLPDVYEVGTGWANAQSATLAKVVLDPVSVSFGGAPSGSGQSLSSSIALSNLLGSGPYTATVTNQTGGGVAFAATVSGNMITVTMAPEKGSAAGSRQGILRISSGGPRSRMPRSTC